MALAASTNFSLSRDDLIKASYQHIGALEDGGTLTATQTTEGALLLNMLIKNWQGDGMQLWMKQYGYIFPTLGVSKISLGAEGGRAASSYSSSVTNSGATTGGVAVTSVIATDLAVGDVLGLVQDDATIIWTVVTALPGGNIITFEDPLTDDMTSGNILYYGPRLKTPWEILEAFTRDFVEGTDAPMDQITDQEYNLISNKTTVGVPLQWYYDKTLGFSTSGFPGNADFYFWPRFENNSKIIVIRCIKRFDDLDATGDNPEFPQNWFLPLMLGLAWLLAPKHGIPLKERQMLFQEADMFKKDALHADQESGSLYFSQSFRGKT